MKRKYIKAKFIGEDGSMGYKEGKIYYFFTDIRSINGGVNWLWINPVDSQVQSCPYTNLEKLLENWELLK